MAFAPDKHILFDTLAFSGVPLTHPRNLLACCILLVDWYVTWYVGWYDDLHVYSNIYGLFFN